MKNTNPMTIVSSYFFYMWNAWNVNECKITFPENHKHFWDKWCSITNNDIFGSAEKFYSELSDNNRELLVNRAITVYNGKSERTPKSIQEETLNKSFPIIHLSRHDLEDQGYDSSQVTDKQMENLCKNLSDSYCEILFSESLKIQANRMGIPKRNPIKKRLSTLNGVVTGHLEDMYQSLCEYLQEKGLVFISKEQDCLYSIEYESSSSLTVIERNINAIRLHKNRIQIFSSETDQNWEITLEDVMDPANEHCWKDIKNSCIVIFVQTFHNILNHIEHYG